MKKPTEDLYTRAVPALDDAYYRYGGHSDGVLISQAINSLTHAIIRQSEVQRELLNRWELTNRYVVDLIERWHTDVRIAELKATKWEEMYRHLAGETAP